MLSYSGTSGVKQIDVDRRLRPRRAATRTTAMRQAFRASLGPLRADLRRSRSPRAVIVRPAKAGAFCGRQSHRGNSRSPVAWVAGSGGKP